MINPERSTLAVHSGRIFTADPARPDAEALFARDGRLVAVGGNGDVLSLAARCPECRVIDLEGRRVLPGLIDSHIHFTSLGFNLDRVDLKGVAKVEVVLERVGTAARAAGAGEWVQGWGWDHSLWPGQRFPDKQWLDSVAPAVPVALRRNDGHLTWLNSAALAAAGIDRHTPDPHGGRVGRGADGEPNGLLFETANALVLQAIPEPTVAETMRAVHRAMAEVHRLGVTGIHVPEGPAAFGAFQRLEAHGALDLRVYMMLARDTLEAAIAAGLRTGFGSDRLTVGPVKIFVDGSLGSETAAMLGPFEGSAGNRGILTIPEDEIAAAVERAARHGIACAIHAIGDRANRVVLDAFEASREHWGPLGLRQRIEHAQVLHPDDLPRFAGLGVIASMQPIHSTQDMDLVDRLWGARGRYAYAFRTLLESGARLAFGSDAPVETPDPLAGLYAAVARRRADGRPEGGWYPQERVPIESAIRAYTIDAAYAAGWESRAGSLTPGKYADFVVLSHDIVEQPAEAILEARVTHTVVGGNVVFEG